jgi:hypothetical protein
MTFGAVLIVVSSPFHSSSLLPPVSLPMRSKMMRSRSALQFILALGSSTPHFDARAMRRFRFSSFPARVAFAKKTSACESGRMRRPPSLSANAEPLTETSPVAGDGLIDTQT